MLYLEISKKYLDKHYKGKPELAIQKRDGVLFDDTRVKNAFSDGWEGFFRYKKDNMQYCYFIKL